jgi:hypothetical protein
MSADSFCGVLKEWEGSEVIIINPESYSLGQLGDKITFETYPATLSSVTQDCIQVTFSRSKKGQDTPVEQYIPFSRIKRASVWGGEKFIQI